MNLGERKIAQRENPAFSLEDCRIWKDLSIEELLVVLDGDSLGKNSIDEETGREENT